ALAAEAIQQCAHGVLVPGRTRLQRRDKPLGTLRRFVPQQFHHLAFGFADCRIDAFWHWTESFTTSVVQFQTTPVVLFVKSPSRRTKSFSLSGFCTSRASTAGALTPFKVVSGKHFREALIEQQVAYLGALVEAVLEQQPAAAAQTLARAAHDHANRIEAIGTGCQRGCGLEAQVAF